MGESEIENKEAIKLYTNTLWLWNKGMVRENKNICVFSSCLKGQGGAKINKYTQRRVILTSVKSVFKK